MTKSDGRCIYCGAKFTYDSTSNQNSDYRSFGGDICSTCNQRGLGYFVMCMQEAAEQMRRELVAQYATQIGKVASQTEGDWWHKNSPLFKALCGESMEMKLHYGRSVDGHGAFVVAARASFIKDGRRRRKQKN